MSNHFGPTCIGANTRSLISFAMVAAVCAMGLTAPSEASELEWLAGAQKLQVMQSADMQRTLRTELDASRRHFVVSFSTALDASAKKQLETAGIELLSPLGGNSYFAAARNARLDFAKATSFAGLRALQPIATEYKMHPLLMSPQAPSWALANEVETVDSPDPTIGAYIVFHRDVNLDVDGYAICQRNGAIVRDELRTINGLVIELPFSQVQAVAAEDGVQWIEPPLPRMTYENDSNRARTQADVAQAAPYSLDGSGVTVLVYDGGTARSTHVDFQGRLTVHDASGEHYHPTHVAGTIGGAGVANATYKGMAPACTLLSYGYEYDGSGIFLYSNPGDIEDDYDEAINTYGAEVANNSIGTNTCSNGFDCSITGNYGATAAVIDAIVAGSLGEPFRILWANGNERGYDYYYCPGCHWTGGFYSTAPPSTAKNHITVGAVNSNDDSMTDFSSFGPTDDGRIKPDICAPGCQSNGDNGVTSTWNTSDTAYDTICGTSMATPTATGCAALLIEDYKVQYPGADLFRNSTLKTWLAHTAVDLGNTGPDYMFGYGSIRIQDAIDWMRSGPWIEDSITQGGSFSRTVTVSPGDTEFKVTLAWDDVPGTPNVNPALVNDLDLRVYGPGSVRYYPWTLDPANPANAAVRTQEDHLNNIEQVLVTNPTAGVWTVEVYGYNVPDGPQAFSLCGDGATQNGISIGLPNGVPSVMTPGVAEDIDVEITAAGESIVPGSPTMHWRYDGGTFQTQSLTFVSGDLYRGTLPGPACGDVPEFYFSAQGTLSGTVSQPGSAPLDYFSATVGTDVTLYTDNFQTDQGWVAENLGASSGDWEIGTPVNDPSWAYDPESDSDGSGQCLLTENATGNTDIDGGAVRVTSPTYDLSGGNITIGYDYYLYLTNTSGAVDMLLVEMNTNNGVGTWYEIARHTTDGGLAWRSHVITPEDIAAAGLTPTSQTKIRFTANDADAQSIVEAGVDALYITGLQCLSSDGACCAGDGTCTIETSGDCASMGGTYQGDGTSCSPNPCPQPPGACCYADGSCTDEADQATCEGLGGTWEGHGTDCAGTTCPIAPGACCYVDGSCTDEADQATCEGLGGTWEGHGTDCAGTTCPIAPGACCYVDGSCTDEADQATCEGLGGTWEGHGTDCAGTTCPIAPGACCFVDGSCTDEADQAACEGLGGTWEGHGTDCAGTTCPIAPGACCYVDGSCTDEANQAACEGLGGTWEGHGTDCAGTTCPIAPGACCYVDGSCTDEANQATCEGLGGTWEGHGTDCAGTTCPIAPGACCYVDGSCTDEADQATCEGLGGTWEGHGTDCAGTTCPIAPGACCYVDGSCTDEADQATCEGLGGTWEGHGTDCAGTTCPIAPGACCYVDGSCTDEADQATCEGLGGTWEGHGTDCAGTTCPIAPGACCYVDGSCTDEADQATCEGLGGTWEGHGTDCAGTTCPIAPGACCHPDGSCTDEADHVTCEGLGGTWEGHGTDCAGTTCPIAPGACCYVDGSCTDEANQAACEGLGGTWEGHGTDCAGTTCPIAPGACCYVDGSCTDEADQATCEGLGGTWEGHDTDCASTECPQPIGACCLDGGVCQELTQAECGAASGVYQGDGTGCDPNPCTQPCTLLGDIDGSGAVNGDDIQGYVRTKLGVPEPQDNTACADFGTGTVDGDTAAFVQVLLGL